MARKAHSTSDVSDASLAEAIPHPTMLPAPIEQECVAEHRNLFCPSYDPCLDIALAQRWPSWTCARCAFFTYRHEAAELVRFAASRASDGDEAPLEL
ncbi:MAG TPA: hypothetical protein VMT17_05075 [Anaeromyxobacteraceae bacterium]|nr:hypothetical protein [Anaeromyxobacteraceae bacterium]